MGRIESFRVREGDWVRSGQVLAELENRDLEASVQQAQAGVVMAAAQLENARAMHDRMVGLHEKGSVTDKNLEDAVAGLRVAEAAMTQAEANEQAARVMLEYAEVKAPISGWVVAKMAEAGDIAAPGHPLVTIEDLSRVKISLQVPERDVVGLERGSSATATIDVLGRSYDATVDRIVPAGDPGSRTFDVRLVLDNADGAIKSGMFARAAFQRGTRLALVVPADALVRRGQLSGIFVIDDDGRARLRWVTLGGEAPDGIEVLSGLEAGERFVSQPPPVLVDGSPVREG